MNRLLGAWLILFLIAFKALAQDQGVYSDQLDNGWQNWSWATVGFANKTPVHGGSNSILVSDTTSSSQALYLHHNAMDSSLYQSLNFWIYPTQTGSSQLVVRATLGGTAKTIVKLSFTAGQVNTWQQITLSLSSLGVANSTSFDGFWIQNNTGTANKFYVDDATLVAVPPPNPVTVTVNPQNVIRVIDDRLFGINGTMWDPELSSATSAALLTTMNMRAIRIPGGSLSDDYNWQTDRGISNGGTFQWATNAAAFAKIIEARGAEAYVTVNYGSGTPEQAAAWVAYYNGATASTASLGVDSKGRDWKTVGYWASLRASSPLGTDDGYNFLRISHPTPFGMEYWEVGNECYGSWEYDQHGVSGSGLGGIAHDPYTYGQAFKSFYNQMLAVDPSIRIGAVGIPGEDAYGIGTHGATNPNESNSVHTGWSAVMLATVKSLGITPDFLVCHEYPQDPGSESDSSLLQASSLLPGIAANLRKMITDYIGAGAGAGIELAMTEMNSVSSNPGKQSVSLVSGLFMADAIGRLVGTEFNACTQWAFRNSSSTSYNNSSDLYGWRQFGDFGMVARGDISGTPVNTRFPISYANEMLTHWGRGGDRLVSGTTNYSLLSTYATQLANGSLALLVVNKHPTNDITAQLTLNSFTTGTSAGVSYSYGKTNDLALSGLTSGTFNNAGSSFSYTFPS